MRILAISVVVLGVMALVSGGCSREEAGKRSAAGAGERQELVQAPLDKGIGVTVNGEAVANQTIAEEESRLMQQFGPNVDPQQMAAIKETVRKQALENVIGRVLLMQAIATEGITSTQDEIDSRMAEIREQAGSEEVFAQRLAMLGMTEAQLESEMRNAINVDKLLERHRDIGEVTDADMEAYYNANRQRFKQPERVRARHILIETKPEDTAAEKSSSKAEADRLLGELKQGGDFEALARQHSSCPSKERGGDLGFFQRGQMVKPFEDVAFALKVGQVSDVVETQFGYHIIEVTDREEEREVPFEEAKHGIGVFLDGMKRNEAMNSYLEEVRASAVIEYPDAGGQQ